MSPPVTSLEDIIRASKHALVIGVGGGGDVVGALATGRFLEFCGLDFTLGGLSWERNVYDPIPGPRKFSETLNVAALHPHAWMANPESQTSTGVPFAEAKMAAASTESLARRHQRRRDRRGRRPWKRYERNASRLPRRPRRWRRLLSPRPRTRPAQPPCRFDHAGGVCGIGNAVAARSGEYLATAVTAN